MVIFNQSLSKQLGLCLNGSDGSDGSGESKAANLLSGSALAPHSKPIALAYAGHQYGSFVILGDGRAHLLGEVLSNGMRIDLQLKGSGRTPFSRGGDGRAGLGPMLREYLISEAMHALRIPTTRSLSVVSSGEYIVRQTRQPGAILCRTAASHIRIGNFELLHSNDDIEGLNNLCEYVINRHYPYISSKKNKALALLEEVMLKQIDLVIDWMRVGFVHGVMNTDNCTISGETIDYGPCAFLDEYHSHKVFSSIDRQGRYSFTNQANIALWNLIKFSETLLPIIEESHTAVGQVEAVLSKFNQIFSKKWYAMMGQKIGIQKATKNDEQLIIDLLTHMQKNACDYTNTFRNLATNAQSNKDNLPQKWQQQWRQRLAQQAKTTTQNTELRNKEPMVLIGKELMDWVNPSRIPRNHLVEHVLQEAERDNMVPFHEMLAALQEPYESNQKYQDYTVEPAPQQRVVQTFCGT